ncbi:SgcJ/EcaC family oxidoreductase (plasmid) [Leisingera sp. S132]|uniref:SgcJ/EcaC family oxidoreductase n=1 Tax=Leisingera sp. S132 TaxID=2867016 RepID=UPI0021A3198E|nr:SgcJ/EcaC family oxidoreductase [Leisingera sp. S132]UWQ81522.1 SgcJ/EcaC family oxidoreductase [Leisingera sp. S132]
MPMPETPDDIPRLFAEAWNARDARALAALFAEDADFVNVVGLWWHNRVDIEKAHAYGLSTFFRHSEITARGIKVRRVGGDTAIIHTRWKLAGQIDKAGETLEDRFAIMVFFAQRLANGWTVLAAHNTDVIPGMETIAAKDGSAFAVNYRDGE